MKFGQLIDYNWRIMQKMRQGDWFQTSFLFFKNMLYEVKSTGQHLSLDLFW